MHYSPSASPASPRDQRKHVVLEHTASKARNVAKLDIPRCRGTAVEFPSAEWISAGSVFRRSRYCDDLILLPLARPQQEHTAGRSRLVVL